MIKNISFALLLLLISGSHCLAQEDAPEAFAIVETMPEFPGGEEALFQYLSKNIKYPKEAAKGGVSGLVMIQFIVSKEGEVQDAKVLRGIGEGCDAEALRVINAMPAWSPGTQKGKAVRVQYTLPIRFQLSKADLFCFIMESSKSLPKGRLLI